ncbi:hypothetical protein SUGI_0912950 [Cryptomeria japonica]|nr:hypothetical protein SUGI_0912950 [Cryptomeria japonica]
MNDDGFREQFFIDNLESGNTCVITASTMDIFTSIFHEDLYKLAKESILGIHKFEGGDDDDIRIYSCEFSQYHKVVLIVWQGMVYVDFREFYTKDRKQLPSKKSISFSLK